jgi:hypothetical protein
VKENNEIRTNSLSGKKVKVINRDVAGFIFFLLLSFAFWYLNSLGKEIEAEMNYSVKFVNPPKAREISTDKESNLTLFLKGPGYSILKLKIYENKAPVLIDISKVNYKKAAGYRDPYYYIVTSSLIKSLSVQLKSECEITSIKPDTLFFTMEKIISGQPNKLISPDNKQSSVL